MTVRRDHKKSLAMWRVIDHTCATWSVLDGLEFNDYYYVHHKLFKRIKRLKHFGYKADQHPEYINFKSKHGIE